MVPLRLLLIYVGAIFVGGALLAPWAHGFVHWGADYSSLLKSLQQPPFHRFVNRSLIAIAVVGLWPFLRGLGIRSWADIGLAKPAGQWRNLAKGLALGLGSLSCAGLAALAAGSRSLDLNHSVADCGRHLLNASAAAAAVGLLEEILFRGALFGAMRKAMRWHIALVISSACYALVHFFQRAGSPEQVTWLSGLVVLGDMMRSFVDVNQLAPGFFCLLLAGMLLGLAYQRTGTLYFSIGLHAGWIFCLKTYGFVTQPTPSTATWLWGTEKLIDSWMALAVLALVWAVMWQRLSQTGKAAAEQ